MYILIQLQVVEPFNNRHPLSPFFNRSKAVYSHFTKPTYQRSKSEMSSSSRSSNRQIDDPLFDETDICVVEEFGEKNVLHKQCICTVKYV